MIFCVQKAMFYGYMLAKSGPRGRPKNDQKSSNTKMCPKLDRAPKKYKYMPFSWPDELFDISDGAARRYTATAPSPRSESPLRRSAIQRAGASATLRRAGGRSEPPHSGNFQWGCNQLETWGNYCFGTFSGRFRPRGGRKRILLEKSLPKVGSRLESVPWGPVSWPLSVFARFATSITI